MRGGKGGKKSLQAYGPSPAPQRSRHPAEEESHPPPSFLSFGPLHLSLLWVAWTNLASHVHSTYLFYGSLGPTSPPMSTPPISSMGRLDQPRPPSRPLHLSLLWVAWTNLAHSCLVSRTCPYCRQVCGFSRQLVKGVKANEAFGSLPPPTQKNPQVRDKREFF